MAAPAPSLMYRQAMHGRSGGIIVLTAGFFWFGLAAVAAVVCALALLAPDSLLHAGARWIFTGIGMGIDMWVSAAYVILRAERLSTAWA